MSRILAELNKNPEYVKKVKACSDDEDAMLAVFKEYTGIDMSCCQLKQFALRQAGLIQLEGITYEGI